MQESGIRQHPGTRGTDLTAPFWQKLNTGHCISTVPTPTVSSRRRNLVRSQVKFGWYGDGIRETSPLLSGGLELTFNLLRAQQSFSGPKNCNKVPCSVLEVLNKNVFAH